LVLAILLIAFYQGKRKPIVGSEYVALGSSFAAGLGLGMREPASPYICQRSLNGYPRQLARLMKLSLTDMTCSGALVTHVLYGGQFFQGPQIEAIGPGTKLVTITAGGNDVSYVGDLMAMAYRKRGGFIGFVVGFFWKGAKPIDDRKFERLREDLLATLHEIGRRAPTARIVVVTYPDILPPSGTCAQIGIASVEADLMRQVGSRLAEVTRDTVRKSGVTLVDAALLSDGHDACSVSPWVNGSSAKNGAPFHPNFAGAQAIAEHVAGVLGGKSF
jgi:lysophospholipase L1-like esterase